MPGTESDGTESESDRHGLVFTGNHLDGIGVKDCARAGEAVARRLTGG